MQQAQDFLDESRALYQLLEPCSAADFQRATGFKNWTFSTVLTHLTFWNNAVLMSLQAPEKLQAVAKEVMIAFKTGKQLPDVEKAYLGELSAEALLAAWWQSCEQVAEAFSTVDPSQRLPWVGPEMSARSSISARLMETWSHAQAIYDELGVERQNTDRIHSIAILGANTYGWTFKNRGEQASEPAPYLRLLSPSGAVWEFNQPNADECIEGLAEEFCQVVTQTRNIADTRLQVTGENAGRWMALAQCFAGPPVNPPAPGTRCIKQ